MIRLLYIYIIFIYIHIFTILGSTPVTFQDSSKAKKQKTDPYASASSPSEYPLVIWHCFENGACTNDSPCKTRFSDNIMVISNSHVELPTSTPFANVKTRERPIYIIYDNICIYVCVTTDLLSPVASTKKREMVGWQLKASHPALQTCSPRNIGWLWPCWCPRRWGHDRNEAASGTRIPTDILVSLVPQKAAIHHGLEKHTMLQPSHFWLTAGNG